MDTGTFKKCLNLSKLWFPEKFSNGFDTKKKVMIFVFHLLSVFRASHYGKLENQNSRLETEFTSRSLTYISGSVIGHNLRKKFLKFMQFHPQNLQQTQKRRKRIKLNVVNFIKKN